MIFLIICFFLITAFSYADAASKPLAADLVEDGQPIDLSQEKYSRLFTELRNEHAFTQEELDRLFSGATISRKVLVLMDKQWEAKPYYQYRTLFVTPAVIGTAREKLGEHREILDRIEKELGVDREVVIAIWGVESKFGLHRGQHNVFQALNTLYDAYPRRSQFFGKQLVHFLLLCRENNMDPHEILGSYAGAFGQTQFIPSSFREYAVSFDGDNQRDVFHSVEDILASIANYLKRHRWVLHAPIYFDIGSELRSQELISANLKGRTGRVDWQIIRDAQKVNLPMPTGNPQLSVVGLEVAPDNGGGFRYVAGYQNFHAITAWNNSNRYAMAVTELAEAIRQ